MLGIKSTCTYTLVHMEEMCKLSVKRSMRYVYYVYYYDTMFRIIGINAKSKSYVFILEIQGIVSSILK